MKEDNIDSYIIVCSVVCNEISNLQSSFALSNTIFLNNLYDKLCLVFACVRTMKLSNCKEDLLLNTY